jgi:2-C-methyl-D-erythritol 4-phosphate cytidylyltransferase
VSAGAVIVAAGKGERLGAPKQFLPLGGRPLLLWSCRTLLRHPSVEHVVVVLPQDAVDNPPEWLPTAEVICCAGGATRRESAGNGVSAVPDGTELILIHDAARPFVSHATIDAVLTEAAASGAALPTMPLSDSVKRARHGRVTGTVDRSELVAAQTPQGFRADIIRAVHDWARREDVRVSDDASLCEMRGHRVACVPGDPENLKVTTATDLAFAEWLVESGRVKVPVIGGGSGGQV